MQWRLAIAWMRVTEADWRWERRSQDSPRRPFVYPFAGVPSTWHVDGIWWAWILWSEKISFKGAGRELWWGSEPLSLSWFVQVKGLDKPGNIGDPVIPVWSNLMLEFSSVPLESPWTPMILVSGSSCFPSHWDAPRGSPGCLLSGGPRMYLGRLSSVLCPVACRWTHSQLSTCLPLCALFDVFSFGSLVLNPVFSWWSIEAGSHLVDVQDWGWPHHCLVSMSPWTVISILAPTFSRKEYLATLDPSTLHKLGLW